MLEAPVRRAQTVVEYMLVIAVLVIAIYAVMVTALGPFFAAVPELGASLGESLTEDGIQDP